MIILGAGLSGLIAGNMLRRFKPVIYEAQPSLPNNHAALLRFRTDAVSNACAVPFKKVKVHKAIWFDKQLHSQPNLEMINCYAKKVTGKYQQRSIENLSPSERYIAPQNFIYQVSQNIEIEYNKYIDEKEFEQLDGSAKISTIPMDVMMDLVGWGDKPDFKYLPIWSVSVELEDVDLYQTVYFPGDEPYYRASITGNRLIVEYIKQPDIVERETLSFVDLVFGIEGVYDAPPKVKSQKYGKLLPIDESVRKEFMLHLTKKYNIYSLGRFATWRQILLDDVVKDVNVIESLMQSSGYDTNKHWNAS